MKKRGYIIVGSAFVLFSAIFLAVSFRIHVNEGVSFLVGPRFLPQVYSLGLLLLSLGFLRQAVLGKNPKGQTEGGEEEITEFPAKVLLAMLLTGLYIWLMPILGYFVSSAIGFIVLLRLLNVRRWATVLGFTGCF